MQELSRRGVSAELVKAALEEVFGVDGLRVRWFMEEEAAEDAQSAWSPTVSPESALLQAARRQWALTVGLPKEARARRFVGWMQRRGHAWDDISRLLQAVQKEEELKAAAAERHG